LEEGLEIDFFQIFYYINKGENKQMLHMLKSALTAAVGYVGRKVMKFASHSSRRYESNFAKRREVGFSISEAAKGAFKETRNYYMDKFTGAQPTVFTQAICYINGINTVDNWGNGCYAGCWF
jgi:hypothetical protein